MAQHNFEDIGKENPTPVGQSHAPTDALASSHFRIMPYHSAASSCPMASSYLSASWSTCTVPMYDRRGEQDNGAGVNPRACTRRSYG